VRQLRSLPPVPSNPESQRVEALKRMISLKDILIQHQQSEIEAVKRSILSEKNDILVYVSSVEMEALRQMREFDLQVKVITDFERQELAQKGDETNHSENSSQDREYLKAVNQRMQKDLLHLREVLSPG